MENTHGTFHIKMQHQFYCKNSGTFINLKYLYHVPPPKDLIQSGYVFLVKQFFQIPILVFLDPYFTPTFKACVKYTKRGATESGLSWNHACP